MMKIALLGYGKMGHEIEKVAVARGHRILLHIDCEAEWNTIGAEIVNADVAIDFSTPDSAISNIHRCFAADVPIVCGTTGWHSQIESIRKECLSENKTLFFASNFSLGVNLFFELNKVLARIMNDHPDYTVNIEETHHIHKLDKPSGTAITIANDIVQETGRYSGWSPDAGPGADHIAINSIRQGEVTGIHTITYESEADSIEIKHTAHNRNGFALGAVLAAEFIHDKKGFFSMSDMLKTG
jgi:4-hydroxy-tetrahydrodipicolinate reductase